MDQHPLLVVAGTVIEVSAWAGKHRIGYGLYKMILTADQLATAPPGNLVLLLGSWSNRRDVAALQAAIRERGLRPIVDLAGTPATLPAELAPQ